MANIAPVSLIATSNVTGNAGEPFCVVIGTAANPVAGKLNLFRDADGDTLALTAVMKNANGTTSPIPSWLSLNNGMFRGTPPAGTSGTFSIQLTASDGKGGLATSVVNFGVTPKNIAPVVANAIATQIATETKAFSFTVPANTFTDANGDTLTLTTCVVNANGSAGLLPSWLKFDATTRTFAGTPPVGSPALNLQVSASDGKGGVVSTRFILSNPAKNSAPVVANLIANQTAGENKAFSFTIPANTFVDADKDVLTFDAFEVGSDGRERQLPSWLTLNRATGTFTGTAPAGWPDLNLRVRANDGKYGVTNAHFTLSTPANTAPTLTRTIAYQFAVEGQAFSFTVPTNTFVDANGDTLSYTLVVRNNDGTTSALPSWLTFNASTLTLTGTPPAGTPDLILKLTANDGRGGSISTVLGLGTPMPNFAPVVANAIAKQTADESKAFSFTVPTNTFTDANGDTLSYTTSVVNADGTTSALPSWMTFNASTRTFTGTPPAGTPDLNLRVTANDGKGGITSTQFTLSTPANNAPTLTGTISSQSAVEGLAWSLKIPANTFVDADKDVLNITAGVVNTDGTISALPSWLKFDVATQTFSGTPPVGSSDLKVQVMANDGRGGSALTSFVIVTPTPGLMSKLTDAGIKADMLTALADGAVSHAEVLKVLQDAAKAGITGEELADLRTIVSYWQTAGSTMTSYDHFTMDAVVNGNVANQWYHGGAATAQTLGNMVVGSTEAQANMLIGKWELGTDLSALSVRNTKYKDASLVKGVTLAGKVDLPTALFGATGSPQITDIRQGYIGDCYLLTSLNCMVAMEPNAIKDMIADNGDGTYGVRFYSGSTGQEQWVTVNKSLVVDGGWGNLVNEQGGALWTKVIEKGYVQFQELDTSLHSGQASADSNNWGSIAGGGFSEPLIEMTGKGVVAEYNANSSNWDSYKSNFIAAINNGQEVWVGSYKETRGANTAKDFIGWHAFAITGYDVASGNFVVTNPWGTGGINEVNPINNAYGYNWQFKASMAEMKAARVIVDVIGPAGTAYNYEKQFVGAVDSATAVAPTAVAPVDSTTMLTLMGQSLVYADTVGSNSVSVNLLNDQTKSNVASLVASSGSRSMLG